jgi:hypothetical protein
MLVALPLCFRTHTSLPFVSCRDGLFVGLLCVLLPMFPVYGLFSPSEVLLSDRVLYVPAFGFAMIVGAGACCSSFVCSTWQP